MTSTVPRMNGPQSRAWIALIGTAELLPHALDTQLMTDAGLINFEYGLLSLLNIADNQAMRMGELAKAADSPAPRLSKAVGRLEQRGFVERFPDTVDGRAVSVRLTRLGRKIWLQATPSHIAFARDTLLAAYTDTELNHLAALLETLLRRLDPEAVLGQVPGGSSARTT